MLSEKNMSYLELSESQIKKYRELEHKEEVLRSALEECGVMAGAIKHILKKSDLMKVDDSNLEVLREGIRNEYKDFIFEKRR